MDVTVLIIQEPWRKLLDSFFCMKRRLSLLLENCLLNSMFDTRFEMYISFFQYLITFARIFFFFRNVTQVVSAHSFEIMSEGESERILARF